VYEVVSGKTALQPSNKPYDWVGPGVYFWQSDPLRAWEWAEQRRLQGKIKASGVIGAVIDLRQCLDLLTREGQGHIRNAYEMMVELHTLIGFEIPENSKAFGGDSDRLLRKLDCAVIQYLHAAMDVDEDGGEGESAGPIPFYDTVRGMFTEGDPIYPGAGFYAKSHVQIAVRNPDCIKGYFIPPEVATYSAMEV